MFQIFTAYGLVCNFTSGNVNTFENKIFQKLSAKPFSFEIGEIDLSNQTASVLTSNGKGSLKIVRAIGANHYLEVITEGYLNITTIYNTRTLDGSLLAAHSRHTGLLGTPIISQYYGKCSVR